MLGPTGPEVTWTCHICGRERPDHLIEVKTHRRRMNGVPLTENVRYCADSEECYQGALKKHFVPLSETEEGGK